MAIMCIFDTKKRAKIQKKVRRLIRPPEKIEHYKESLIYQ